MDDLDLAVVTRQGAVWDALRDVFADWRTTPGATHEAIGMLRPDFGPGYRVRVLLHDRDGSDLARWLDAHRPPYTVAIGLARGMPGKGLDPGDVLFSNAIPGFDWSARVGRGAGSGAEPEAKVDAVLLRGALGLDAVDQRWARRSRVPPPDGARAPRLMAGAVASTLDPIPADTAFDEEQIRAIARRWPKVVGVECDGLDIATAVASSAVRPRVAMLAGLISALPGAGCAEPDVIARAAANAASFLDCWVRYAWPTRPVSAATGQTPKGIRLGDDALTRRSKSGSLPRTERVEVGEAPSVAAIAPKGRDESIEILDMGGDAAPRRPRGVPRPRYGSPSTPDAPERSSSSPVSLRARLARLYPTVDDALRVVREAQLPVHEPTTTGGADVRWHRILELARSQPGGVERLLRVLARDGH